MISSPPLAFLPAALAFFFAAMFPPTPGTPGGFEGRSIGAFRRGSNRILANSASNRRGDAVSGPGPAYTAPLVPRSERFTTPALEGVHLHALHHGDPGGRALVLLHGGGANAHWWDDIAPVLAERFHVVALDFRGHGGSDQPEPRPGAFQRDLAALLEHIGAPDAALVGHSMGAHVALEHAARFGGARRPRALVVVDVARGFGTRTRRLMRLALEIGRAHV